MGGEKLKFLKIHPPPHYKYATTLTGRKKLAASFQATSTSPFIIRKSTNKAYNKHSLLYDVIGTIPPRPHCPFQSTLPNNEGVPSTNMFIATSAWFYHHPPGVDEWSAGCHPPKNGQPCPIIQQPDGPLRAASESRKDSCIRHVRPPCPRIEAWHACRGRPSHFHGRPDICSTSELK